ncbi:MAG: hypothetical protein K9I82_01430 [Chitinophagaceae bacterium]|nr:hypothetical protein [Chitinophagaceae bacterium]
MRILINENQLNNIIKEAIPYNIVKPYIGIKRTKGALKLINDVFDNLKKLPNAKVVDRKGDRVSIPYTGDFLEVRISDLLSKYEFIIKDYADNKAVNIRRPGQETKISSALSLITKVASKLDNKDESNEAKKLIDLYAAARSKTITNMEGALIVFSKHPYDIAGMSYDKSWSYDKDGKVNNCMHLTDGKNRKYIKVDVKNGTIVIFLVKPGDTNLKNPIGRILAKPYVDDDNNFILYPEQKTYGDIDDPKKFINYLEDVFEKVQDVYTEYRLLTCLYPDSPRLNIISKEKQNQKVLEKWETGEQLLRSEIVELTDEQKTIYIESRLRRIERHVLIDENFRYYDSPFATKEQLDRYEKIMLNNKFKQKLPLSFFEIAKLSDDNKIKYIDYRIKEYENAEIFNSFSNPISLSNLELSMATEKQKARYFDKKLADFYETFKTKGKTPRVTKVLEDYEIDHMPSKHFDKLISLEIKENMLTAMYVHIYSYYKRLSQSQKKEIISKAIKKGDGLSGDEWVDLTDDEKNEYISNLIDNNDTLSHSVFMSMSKAEKIDYIKKAKKLTSHQELWKDRDMLREHLNKFMRWKLTLNESTK